MPQDSRPASTLTRTGQCTLALQSRGTLTRTSKEENPQDTDEVAAKEKKQKGWLLR